MNIYTWVVASCHLLLQTHDKAGRVSVDSLVMNMLINWLLPRHCGPKQTKDTK